MDEGTPLTKAEQLALDLTKKGAHREIVHYSADPAIQTALKWLADEHWRTDKGEAFAGESEMYGAWCVEVRHPDWEGYE